MKISLINKIFSINTSRKVFSFVFFVIAIVGFAAVGRLSYQGDFGQAIIAVFMTFLIFSNAQILSKTREEERIFSIISFTFGFILLAFEFFGIQITNYDSTNLMVLFLVVVAIITDPVSTIQDKQKEIEEI